MIGILSAIFFLSGAAGLIFETLWFRQAGLVFGNSFWASSIVLSSFMTGLCLGNGLAARYGGRVRDPLRSYAALEVAIGLTGVALVWSLPGLTGWLAPWLRPFSDVPWLLNGVRLASGFALMVIPATAMGATLPLLVRVLLRGDANFGSALGRLYGWNTLGAVLGALAPEVGLVEWLGIRGSSFVAAAANATAAVGVMWLARRVAPLASPEDDAAPIPIARAGVVRRCLLAAALSGASLLALEVVWFRFLHLFVHGGPLAFAVMLAVVLAGIALGGLLAGQWLRRDAGAVGHTSALAWIGCALVVATYAAFRLVLEPYEEFYVREPSDIVALSLALMFPSSLLSGVLFTFVGSLLQREIGAPTRSAGLVTLANTAGSAAGSLLAGFVMLPLVGVERSFFCLAAGYAIVGLLLWRVGSEGRAGFRVLAAAAAVVALAVFPSGMMDDHYRLVAVNHWGTPEQVVAVREGRTETAIYLRHEFLGEDAGYKLLTDGYSMSGTDIGARRYMKLYVYWPVALRPDPERALLISYGVGTTASALTATRSLERIDVVDISRDIIELSEVVFSDPATHPLRDPRVRVHIEDGRYFLQTTEHHYDLITGEPPPPKIAGVVNLYTREYFQLVRDRLTDGGITTYWLPMHNLRDDDAKAIVRGFCDVFDDCTLWVGNQKDWMLVGSRNAAWSRSEAEFSRQWQDPVVGPDLRRLGIEFPEQLGATFIADHAQLDEITRDTPPLTDDHPKRLSSSLSFQQGTPFRSMGFDVSATRERFRKSEFIRRAWPAELRERTLAYFEQQQLLNVVRSAPWEPVERLTILHALLQNTELRTLPLWVLGTNHDRVDVARRTLSRGRDLPAAYSQLGMFALANRDFEAASQAIATALGLNANARMIALQQYALCAQGRCEEALALARKDRDLLGRHRKTWRWMRDVFAKGDRATPSGAVTPSR